MSKTVSIVLNWIFLIATLVVNGLANTLPINGLNTAEVSARYPNYFVPAGFTFGIWGFIYLLLLLHVIYSTYILVHEKRCVNCIGNLVNKINPLFRVTCILNISWLLAWHYLQVTLSVVIMVALFLTLLKIFGLITIADRDIQLGYMEHISLETPFIIYFSWIAVALIANITAMLVSFGWAPANEITWTCIMIGVAGLIGISLSIFWHRPAYTAVIIWALIGIYIKQANTGSIALTTIISATGCLLAAAFGFWMKRKLLFRSSVQAD